MVFERNVLVLTVASLLKGFTASQETRNESLELTGETDREIDRQTDRQTDGQTLQPTVTHAPIDKRFWKKSSLN